MRISQGSAEAVKFYYSFCANSGKLIAEMKKRNSREWAQAAVRTAE
jgi:hypothetical protein